MTETERKQRNFASLAVIGGDAFQTAAKVCAEQMTVIVMHPGTSPEERAEALSEYHALTRLNSYLEMWANDARREIENA